MMSHPTTTRPPIAGARGISLAEVAISLVVLAILVIVGFSSAAIGTSRSVDVARAKVARDIGNSIAESLHYSGRPVPLPSAETIVRNNETYTITYAERIEGVAPRSFAVITVTVRWGDNNRIYEVDAIVPL